MIAPRRSGGTWRRVLLPLVAALLASIGLTLAPPEAAGSPSRFVLEQCDSQLPGGGVPTTSAVVDPGVPIAGFETCAQGGGGIGLEIYAHTNSGTGVISVVGTADPGGLRRKRDDLSQGDRIGARRQRLRLRTGLAAQRRRRTQPDLLPAKRSDSRIAGER